VLAAYSYGVGGSINDNNGPSLGTSVVDFGSSPRQKHNTSSAMLELVTSFSVFQAKSTTYEYHKGEGVLLLRE
jgi:hypothetical protein